MKSESLSIPEIEEYIESALQEWNIPGGAVAIIKDDQVLSSRGYGSREIGKNEPVTQETLFGIGSCSKAFTATLIGMLVDDGSLNWDDKIIHFLPEFKLYDPWITNEVTLRDMLSHRTGLQRCIRLLYRDKIFNCEDIIRRMHYIKPLGEFRTRFSYNNPHYNVAGNIAEVVTGKPWKTLISERIFQPLGMHSSMSSYQELLQSGSNDVAFPHANLNCGFSPSELCVLDPVEPIPWTDYGENAAGSIISTLSDMTAWLRLFMEKGAHQGKQILSPTTLNEMTSPQMIIKAGESEMDPIKVVGLESYYLSYGLGWYVSDYHGQRMIFHPGQIHGFVSAVAFLPDLGIGGIVLLNTYQTMLHPMLGYYIFDAMMGIRRDYSDEMKSLVSQWRAGAEAEIQPMLASRSKEAPTPAWLDQFIGEYSSEIFGEISISLEGNQLRHHYGSSQFYNADLEPWQGETFLINYYNKLFDPEFLTFTFDEQNKVKALVVLNVDTFKRI